MSWLQEIEEFTSLDEFENFVKYLSDRIKEGELKEIEAREHYFGDAPIYKDRWFADASSSETWCLVHPDYPFKGFFKPVIYPLEKAYNPD